MKIEIIILAIFVIWSAGWLITYIALKAILFYLKAKKICPTKSGRAEGVV